MCNGILPAAHQDIHTLDRRHRPLGGRRHTQLLCGGVDQAPIVLPAIVLIAGNHALLIGTQLHLPDVRRTVSVPTLLIGSRELHAHRLACQVRNHRSGLGHIVIAAVAIGASAFSKLHADLFGLKADQGCNATAGILDVL